MKKIISTALTITLLFAVYSPKSHADEDLLRLAVSLCDFAKADDRSSMRRKLKAAGMKLRAIYPAIQCGAEGSLLRVAANNNAMEAAKFLVSKAGKKSLEAAEADGKNILQWAEALAAADASKQAFLDLVKSKM
ncbi:MAG: DUF3718 domain-containing protein [Kangiellaceae bacterium]|jgi:hypothetical protein|nr:DUF3718 domain-containing protein [Kangiellaceae bacterium]